MGLSLKATTRLFGIQPELEIAVIAVNDVFGSHNADCVITSGTERTSRHMRTSAHWTGRAFDVRIRHLSPIQKDSIFDKIKSSLNEEFDVVRESDHFHIEYDPKG